MNEIWSKEIECLGERVKIRNNENVWKEGKNLKNKFRVAFKSIIYHISSTGSVKGLEPAISEQYF